MEIAPAMSSAMPPNTTIFESPRDERPAVKANGTVSLSERPMTLCRGQLTWAKRRGNDKENVHVSDSVRIDEPTLILPDQLPAANTMSFLAVCQTLCL